MANYCVNLKHPDIKTLSEQTGIHPLEIAAAISIWQEENNTYEFPSKKYFKQKEENVKATLKAVDILSSDKAKQIFIKGKKAGWNLDKILTELFIPKEQRALLLDLGVSNREELALELASKYGYTIEINTSKEKDSISQQEANRSSGLFTEEELESTERNTGYYSNLTVPGGTNYTENEIATPEITPTIKGHAQFSTNQGIGWFRSDEASFVKQAMSVQNKEKDFEFAGNKYTQEYSLGKGFVTKKNGQIITEEEYRKAKYASPKTRRILEVQSDLFQKGRDKQDLITREQYDQELYRLAYNNGVYTIWDSQGSPEDNYTTKEEAERELERLNKPIKEFKQKEKNKGVIPNQFLQLLNKDNNWVTFFVKSIIQDSAKKGYEKVLFPSGNTASKVEGHTTLEEFKKQKEDRIKELEKNPSWIANEEYINEISAFKLDGKIFDQGSKLIVKDGFYNLVDYDKSVILNKEQAINFLKEAGITPTFVSDKKEITQLKQELKRVETEGFGALKPIFNFYENTVTNVLKKTYGKENVKQVTDEYGNTWNEITLTEKNKETFFYQDQTIKDEIKLLKADILKYANADVNGFVNKGSYTNLIIAINKANKELGRNVFSTHVTASDSYVVRTDRTAYQEDNKGLKKIDKDLENKIKKFLESIGVTYVSVYKIKDENGNPLSAVAVAKMMAKIIEVVEGKADITTLPEEAAHFFVDMLKDNQLLEKMIYNIDKYDVYQEVINSKFYQEQYKGNDRKMRIEAVGKQIVKSILRKQEESNSELNNKFKRFWNSVWNKIKYVFMSADKKAVQDLFDSIGEDILSGNVEKLDVNKNLKDDRFYKNDELALPEGFSTSIKNNTITLKGKAGRFIGELELFTPKTDSKGKKWYSINIETQVSGYSKYLYNEALKEIDKRGGAGIISYDTKLATPEKSISTRKHFKTVKSTDKNLIPSIKEQKKDYEELLFDDEISDWNKERDSFKDVTLITSKEQVFYQSSNKKQDEIIDNLDNKFNISLNEEKVNSKTGKKGVYELVKDGVVIPILNRVSDVVEAVNKKRGFSERTNKQKAEDEVRRIVGNKGHSDINNIITRIVEKNNGISNTQIVKSLDDNSYNELEKFFVEFIKSFPAGSKFYSEKTIYDEFKNEAGTMDLLVILPTGEAEIYDWKFIEFKQKDANGRILSKSVAWYKEENYNIQLTRYRQILRSNYGVEKFGKTRVVPISAEYNNNKLTSLEIGNKKIDGIDKPYLEQIPISGLSKEELGVEYTGNERIDELIKVLLQQRKQITDKTEYTSEGKIKKTERLSRINNSIKRLQIEGDIKAFLDDAVFELNYISNIGIVNLNNDDLVRAKALVDYYSDLHKYKIIPDDQAIKYKETLIKVTLNAQDIYSKITDEYESRIKEIALDQGVNNIKELQPETGLLAKLFNTISQNNHPIVKAFYRLVMKQKDMVYKETEELNTKIKDSLKELEKWGLNKGINGLNLFNDILQFKDGKKTGKLINRWDPEYYTNKDKAIDNKNYKWLIENTEFDLDKYEEYFTKNKNVWENMYKGDVDGEQKLQRRIEEYMSKYDVRYSNSALVNKSNRYIKPKAIWRSKEWTKLQSPENKPLKDFYDLFTSTINEFREHLPLDLNGNFIPNIKNDLMDQIMTNGLNSISGMGDSIIQHLKAESDESIGMIDDITGEKTKSIPLLYTKEIDSNVKSYDLGKVLALFGNMALNYKYMSEIESSSEMLRDVLSSQKQTINTSGGKAIKSKVTDTIASFVGSSDTLDQFNSFFNFYIYGMKTTGKSTTFKLLKNGESLSVEKTLVSSMRYYVTKALAFNLLPGAANLLGGQTNAFFEGVKGRFYNNSEYTKGLGMMSSANKKAFAAIEYFDLSGSSTNFQKANNLSVSSITKNITLDKLHILQRAGDYTVENGVLLAMLQSHTIRDGIIVKKNESEKSMLDLMDTSKDKVNIEGLTDNEFYKFRRKIKFLYGEMKGNSNPDDISTIKLTVLGQAVMMFRGWIPKMANERFGDLKYVGDLEVWEMGKYKSFVSQVLNKQIIPNIFNSIIAGGVLGIGANSINSKSVTQKAIQLYNEAKAKNPDLKITQEEFIELHKQNIRSSAMELQLILLMTILLIGLKPDDDDDKDPERKVAAKFLKRYIQELTFFVDPSSTGSILKKPIPILSLGTDIGSFMGNFGGEIIGNISGDKKQIKRNKPMRYLNRLFPVSSAIENFWALTDDTYNKTSK